MIYFTSDLHFNHDKPFVVQDRGFLSVEEMNETIVRNWNNVVQSEDTVYLLGDIGLNSESDTKLGDIGINDNMEKLKKQIESLNGTIHIIAGNHDTERRIAMYKTCRNVASVNFADRIKYKKYTFFLSHYPSLVSNVREKPMYCLCGHTHTKDPLEHWELGNIIHIEQDAWDMTPVSADKICELIEHSSVSS